MFAILVVAKPPVYCRRGNKEQPLCEEKAQGEQRSLCSQKWNYQEREKALQYLHFLKTQANLVRVCIRQKITTTKLLRD